MKANFSESLRFLRWLRPGGPWTLTAISVDKKAITSRTFMHDEEDKVKAWLTSYWDRNLYYAVNVPVASAYEKTKMSKLDVLQVDFLHVDIDPRVGEHIDDEQTRIRQQLENYEIEPSAVIFSGGGFNALWRLRSPIKVYDESLQDEEIIRLAEDVERRNWVLELDFETPDHCRDVCRILRLPGTINRPDAKKIAKGRVPALATIEYCVDRAYPIDLFKAVPLVSKNTPSSGSRVTGNVERVESLDSLKITDKLRSIIAQGHDPEDLRRWGGDRSQALFYVCCELIRADVPDEQVLGIITDSRFGISASVLDKGSGVTRYAIRQVERAKDYAFDPRLAEMNEQFAVILGYGGETVVMVENGSLNEITGVMEPMFMKPRAFRERIRNLPSIEIIVGDKIKHGSAYDWWMCNPRRREYLTCVFRPGEETPGMYNTWTGFAVQPRVGDKHKRLLDHMYENLCDRDDANFDYLVKWMARTVQEPSSQCMVAPVLIGSRGTGKSVFTDFFAGLFGRHCFVASEAEELTGKFNSHLAKCVLVIAEEAFGVRDNRRHQSVLKHIITGKAIGVEPKHYDRKMSANCIHLIMTANPDASRALIVPAHDHERRFFVMEVSDRQRQKSSYFLPIIEDRNNGGLSHLLSYLMSIDLTNYDVTAFPRTDALRKQQEYNLTYENEWLLYKLETGRWFDDVHSPWQGPIKKKTLRENYVQFMDEVNGRYPMGERAFHSFIMKSLPGTKDTQLPKRVDPNRSMAFVFPPLADCREIFDEQRGWTTSWPAVEDDLDEVRQRVM